MHRVNNSVAILTFANTIKKEIIGEKDYRYFLSLMKDEEMKHDAGFSPGKSLLQLWLVVSPSSGHQGSLSGATLHEHPFH